ncbi:16S rRNA (adenine(1518)-N(6)/adenine(1519)-N(6))-dimethyltransferase RsmA [Aetokthonos hydrillicola Thurmond2011]|jgi:16S rRNA (adenine1518-N6/adenine1519-N6)-dimethyltransferase|uniref:Ribosomal RNA small subunit methyltransferase A n=1 Tax=Aetokthonos hydrillicola Thurmond2011 TaxID=2712845 RepID=A0AAP5MAV8_9CYAN|nr:16S rRNA (adenine(1518)-N(6)/adenine(1519)-N(6))-dimethyltransferase RsmA [Aetokthonos hydrillicola]MBO3458734.1 16S rRNA (adenine(1518)-N(6)/adenine(1519)-N(6))-dimethyltransferase RsmA [Aetokthonos hydrillicola CCALA 1050]MBW4585482.1 16S rRNA (adenine(1518)-N(6)/adenine(1519)-N(6))-dimethyltransferase RsmA [Aetokthonos hydrillicola CCALA 1050]MDR9896104.1 16S rRNA (adenine(1518)-N(6)/adenine(1519)-N(6))-dimethyltransferase RsmA [Aetokthonos hydrillicola Thurmond2011]
MNARKLQEFQPRKTFAQHWLKSEKALNEIVKAAQLQPSHERVLEIGPGTGILTRRLLPLVESLVAVEIDRDLCNQLTKELGREEKFLLLQGDFLSLDLASLLAPFPAFGKPNKVVANIPYNITGPIIEKVLGTIANPNPEPYDLLVLLVQKEVAQRLVAKPGSKAFGALSVRVQYLANCELICIVPAGAFYPPPKVDSAVVRLVPRKIETPALDPRFLETLVKLGFGAKRKMLRNNLQSVVERDRLTQLLEELNINPQARAEDLSVEQWVTLSNQLR